MDIVLTPDNQHLIERYLQSLLARSGAHTTLLVDRSGQLICHRGSKTPEEMLALAALSAANFGATVAIARMIGEKDFRLVFHRGKKENAYYHALREDLLLMTVFSSDTPLGQVRLQVEKLSGPMRDIFEKMLVP